jgi:hypothetical protein
MGLPDRVGASREEPVGRSAEDLARYRYLVRTAPLDVVRRCVTEARLPEDDRAALEDAVVEVPASHDASPAVEDALRERLSSALTDDGSGPEAARAVVATSSARAAMGGFRHSPEARELGADGDTREH